MATIDLNLSGTLTQSSGSFTASAKSATGHGSTIQTEASCSVSYNSTGKYYTVGTVYLKLKGQPSGITANVTSAWGNDTSGNWSAFRFNPSKSSGSLSLTWTSYSNITYSSSTVGVSDIYTDTSKTVKATLAFIFSVKTTQGTEYYNIYVYLNFKLYGGMPIPKYTVRYRYDNGNEIPSYTSTDVRGGSSLRVATGIDSTKTPGSTTTTHNYRIYYDSAGGSAVSPNPKELTGRDRINYVNRFSYWEQTLSPDKGNYSPGQIYTVNGNKNFYPHYDTVESGREIISKPSIGSLPTVYRKGYNKTNTWFDQNGSQVASSSQVEQDNTYLHVDWSGLERQYTVKFNLNGGKMPEDAGRENEYSFVKTYGVGYPLPTFIPTKLGYSFAGWSNEAGTIEPQGAGATMDDRIYNSLYTETTTGNVTLYAKWEYKINTLKFNYWYNEVNTDPANDKHIDGDDEIKEYNISELEVRYGQPVHSRTGDFVFLGWSDVLPTEWLDPSKINMGYHGVYSIPPEVIKNGDLTSTIDLPLIIDTTQFKKLEEWGVTDTYYGIWAKTGKYVKVDGQYKKVSTMYVKDEGTWHKVSDIWTYDNGWHHEI